MKSLSAAVLALSSSLLATSCLQSEAPEPSAEPGEAQTATGEPTDEAREPAVITPFTPDEFKFVTVVKDDGKDKAGGWQMAKTALDFTQWVIPHAPRTWRCPITIEMPLRTELMGLVPPSRAAKMSADVTTDVAFDMGPKYDLPPAAFCPEFLEGVKTLFRSRYPKLGAKVSTS